MDAVERDGPVGSGAEAEDGVVRLTGFLVERGLVAMAVDHETRAGLRESERDGAPDIAARTGNDGNTAGEGRSFIGHGACPGSMMMREISSSPG